MAIEIERKFLVRQLPDVTGLDGTPMVQGYLRADPGGSVRVRITGVGAWLTIKAAGPGRGRLEFEYPLPTAEARQLLDAMRLGSLVEKVRYRLPHAGYTWELDVFSGRNQGLVIAEVELEREDETPPLPDWIGREVTDDPRYYNASLAHTPFDAWPSP